MIKFIKDNIDLEGHGLKNNLSNIYKTFETEYLNPHELKRQGSIKEVIKSWLLGLPSCLDLPFYYHDITPLMYALGYDVEGLNDNQVSNLYYNEIASVIYNHSKL